MIKVNWKIENETEGKEHNQHVTGTFEVIGVDYEEIAVLPCQAIRETAKLLKSTGASMGIRTQIAEKIADELYDYITELLEEDKRNGSDRSEA